MFFIPYYIKVIHPAKEILPGGNEEKTGILESGPCHHSLTGVPLEADGKCLA
jgi:hypothetical protein